MISPDYTSRVSPSGKGQVVEQRTPSCQACLRERHPRAAPQSSSDPVTILSDYAIALPSECHRATSVSRLRDYSVSSRSPSIFLLLRILLLPISILNLTPTYMILQTVRSTLFRNYLSCRYFCRELLFFSSLEKNWKLLETVFNFFPIQVKPVL